MFFIIKFLFDLLWLLKNYSLSLFREVLALKQFQIRYIHSSTNCDFYSIDAFELISSYPHSFAHFSTFFPSFTFFHSKFPSLLLLFLQRKNFFRSISSIRLTKIKNSSTINLRKKWREKKKCQKNAENVYSTVASSRAIHTFNCPASAPAYTTLNWLCIFSTIRIIFSFPHIAKKKILPKSCQKHQWVKSDR